MFFRGQLNRCNISNRLRYTSYSLFPRRYYNDVYIPFNYRSRSYQNSYKSFFDNIQLYWTYILAMTSGAIFNYLRYDYNVDACGIMAVVSSDEEVVESLLDGLLILQNRGYDSAGIATLHPNESPILRVTKYASKGTTSDSLDLLKKEAPTKHAEDRIGIAHTRWATHGAKTDVNAHPHLDYKGRIALVHNGTIENCNEIKEELMKKGIRFRSQTDTEVIANLIGYYLDEKYKEEDALKHALSRLEGSWGIAMISVHRPNEIFAARNGSPLMIGLNQQDHRNFVASEHTAFQRYTNEFIALKDGEIAIVTSNSVSLDKSRVQVAPHEEIPLSPDPFPYWTIKEIMEQPAAISRSLAYGSRLSFDNLVKLGGLEKKKDLLMSIKNLIISGCGTSYHAGLYGQRLMQYLNSFDTVSVVDSAEVINDTFPSQNAGLLVISQSGETKDVLNALEIAESSSIPRFSIVNSVGSAIARATNLGVYIYAGREHAVASTKAFITQVTTVGLVAAWFAQNRYLNKDIDRISQSELGDQQRRNSLIEALHRLPTYCGVTLDTREQCKEIAQKLKSSEHLFVLGKGFAEPIAYEGALKIKEITYIHAEGYSGGALKHGPFALIEDGTPIIMIVLDDQHAKTMITNAHEIEARGAKAIYITNNPNLCKGLKGEIIKIPSNGPLTALLAVIPLQFIAYEISVAKGIDPDRPKNLAKAVTVD